MNNKNNILYDLAPPSKRKQKGSALSGFLNVNKKEDNSNKTTENKEEDSKSNLVLQLPVQMKKDDFNKQPSSPKRQSKLEQLEPLIADLSNRNVLYKGSSFDGGNPKSNSVDVTHLSKTEKDTINSLSSNQVIAYEEDKENSAITIKEINMEKMLFLLSRTLKDIEHTKKCNEQYKITAKQRDKEIKENSLQIQSLQNQIKELDDIANTPVETVASINSKLKKENESLRKELNTIENETAAILSRYKEDIALLRTFLSQLK